MKKLLALTLFTFSFSLFPPLCQAQNISTFAGTGNPGYSGNGGQATAAELNGPDDVILDASGNIYISDYSSNRIREVNGSSGIITTIAGNGSGSYNGDGIPATLAALNSPQAIAFDKQGNLYIADNYNNRVREVFLSNGIITTIAGIGFGGFSGDGGLATLAELYAPSGVAIDTLGNIFISDYLNERIRLVETNGKITTFAGNGYAGFSGDGGLAGLAELNGPTGIRLDKSENLYISDHGNDRVRVIYKFSFSIITIAGNGYAGFSGDGGPATLAELNNLLNIGLDNSGNLFIADQGNERVREVDVTGTITTIAGQGSQGFSGDGGPATAAEFDTPDGVAVGASGEIYIADLTNNRIRKIASPTGIEEVKGENEEVKIYPNPGNGLFTISFRHVASEPADQASQTIVEVYDMLGQKVLIEIPLQTIHPGGLRSAQDDKVIDLSDHPGGIYLYRVKTNSGNSIGEGKLIIQK